MRAHPVALVFFLILSSLPPVVADQLDMQNGDRYFGKVASMNADTIVLESDVLGKINVPRKKVAHISLGVSGVTNRSLVAPVILSPAAGNAAPADPQTNVNLSASLRSLGANTNFISQVRDQMLGNATPEARKKYDELVGGMMSGQLNLTDIRREAKSSADQLRAMKKELGPEADDALDMYLEVLDNFLKQTADSKR